MHRCEPDQIIPITADVVARVAALYEGDPRPMAPVLALGTFERVGSNWISDQLRTFMPQHNEPFRQQLLHPHPVFPGQHIPLDAAGAALGELGRHRLTCALSDLYGSPRHMVKETNLYFATRTVLELLPHSPVIALTREPVGIASSFYRGDLWERWSYRDRYAQLAATAHAPRWREFSALVPRDCPAPPIALGRLLALNTLLLVSALAAHGRTALRLSYEEHVEHPHQVESELAALLGTEIPAPVARTSAAAAGDFATTRDKTTLAAELPADAAAQVTEAVTSSVQRAADFLPAAVVDTARAWLEGSDRYELHEPARPRRARPAELHRIPAPSPMHSVYVPARPEGVWWRNYLATNEELAEFLEMLRIAGQPNTVEGTNLFVCPMPHERGGRLHLDDCSGRWHVSAGYERHPAYWVTWLGAAAFAVWCGARLPTRDEACAAMSGRGAVNAAYRLGDACAVAEPDRAANDVHHMVGNVQVWCSDGPALPDAHPVRRHLVGAAWNTPATEADVRAERSRYLLGSSRSVGVRLVRDHAGGEHDSLGAREIASRLKAWTNDPGDPGLPPGDRDRRLIAALQADR